MKYSLGEFEEIVLLLVAAQNDTAYGLSITKSIKDDLKRPVTLSSVHTALYRLEEKGFVRSHVGGATTERGGRSKRHFIVTLKGKKALAESYEARNKLWNMIPKPVIGDV